MQRSLFVCVFLFLAATACAQSPDEQALLDLSRRKFDWLIQGKSDSLARILDDRLEYVHSNGWVQSSAEVLADMKSGKLVYQRVVIQSASARRYGSAAVVTGLGTFEGVNSGTHFKLDLRYTEVYVLTGRQWKLVSRHSNRMP